MGRYPEIEIIKEKENNQEAIYNFGINQTTIDNYPQLYEGARWHLKVLKEGIDPNCPDDAFIILENIPKKYSAIRPLAIALIYREIHKQGGFTKIKDIQLPSCLYYCS
ncbi:hypothetical protein [Priestia endophytica]|uniref:Uncharacterized protein n=1 Tax=Priestia endophytica DSM 13796 TaxID=1121089 RepID=A0A1I6BDQ3_9BACI|nr:hypothetical protein [Priestia endophytica]KYG26232.1 hypothetical protein AZF06_17040 [Priestia endophytica]SFQ79082.1 hypothetical protein SAMN02745910_03509 [Priestia endophytica DSM 13796]